jgi:uncharacterized phage protein gp47/JayE
MPFDRPTPARIRDRMAADVAARLPGADARLRRSIEGALVGGFALASHELHGHLDWAARQVMPDTAEAEQLERWAGIWGVERRPAAPATGPVTFTGAAGAVVPAGAELRRADDVRYLVDADVAIGGGGTGSGTVAAVVAGAAGNALAGVALTLVAPVAGVQSQAAVAAGGLAAGADPEDDAALLARLMQRIQQPPAGGAAHDYVAWALAVPGVERVWVYPNHVGEGTVGVAFLGTGGAIPGAPLVAEVQAAIDAVRPVTAEALVFAPSSTAVALQIEISPDTAAVRAAIEAELDDFFRREAEPGATVRLSRLSAAVSAAAGETWHRLIAPSADVDLDAGHVAVRGAITWGA